MYLLEEGRALRVLESLVDNDIFETDLLHRHVRRVNEVDGIEDNSCLVENVLASRLDVAMHIHRNSGHTGQERLAEAVQCGYGSGCRVPLEHLLNQSAHGISHHRGAQAAMPIRLVYREMCRHTVGAVGTVQGLASAPSFDSLTRKVGKGNFGAANDLCRPATGRAHQQFDHQSFGQQREGQASRLPRSRQLLYLVFRAGQARNRADQKILHLAGVQVTPAVRRGVVVQYVGDPASGGRQRVLRTVRLANAVLADGAVQVHRRQAPRRGQAKNMDVQRSAIQRKLPSQAVSIKGASATKHHLDPNLTQATRPNHIQPYLKFQLKIQSLFFALALSPQYTIFGFRFFHH